MTLLAGLTAAVTVAGAGQAIIAAHMVGLFARRRAPGPLARPPVTVLKPLHGGEPLLEDALATLCQQDYPKFQVVFGVQDPADEATEVVARLRQRFPDVDMALTIDPTGHGPNRKVGNLINMLPSAAHDILVIADSDIHVRPDYLVRLVSALDQPGIGLVTTLYAGLPATEPSWVARLGATQITHGFLPGAVLARNLGRQDSLGATMCLTKQNLLRAGGFPGLVRHLADDNMLGRRIKELGLQIALADTVPLTTVPETSLRALWRHELRWARTIRALEPLGFAASALQYALFWAALTVLFSGAALWSVALFGAAWVMRAVAGLAIDRALTAEWSGDPKAGLAFCCPVWLLPLRDMMSVAVMVASYGGRRVEWRGFAMLADKPERSPVSFSPIEGTNTQ